MKEKILPSIALVVALVLAYVAFDWAVGAVIHSRKVVAVPDLSAKSVHDALNLLGPLGLGLEKENEQFDKRFPAGAVVHQTPSPGMQVREGRIIRVTLSQGGENLFVPELAGQPLRNAQTSLQNAGLSIGEMERRPSLKFKKDMVMMSDPPQGAIIAKNGLVNLVISEGPPEGDMLLIPDFIGEKLVKAQEWAQVHQLTLSVKEESDISKGDGEILMQSPMGDLPVHPGELMTVVVNRPGPPSENSGEGIRVYYEVPQGASDRDVRISLVDESGEREVFRKSQSPGSKVDIRVQPKGHARVRVLVNGVVVQEKSIQ